MSGRPRSARRDVLWILVVVVIVVVTSVTVSARANQTNSKALIAAQHESDLRALARQKADSAATAKKIAYATAIGDYHTCVGLNKLRSQVRGYIDGVTTRALSSAKATLASPQSTQLMRQTSLRNLAGTIIAQQQIHAALPIDNETGADHCTPPTAPPASAS